MTFLGVLGWEMLWVGALCPPLEDAACTPLPEARGGERGVSLHAPPGPALCSERADVRIKNAPGMPGAGVGLCLALYLGGLRPGLWGKYTPNHLWRLVL